MNTGLIIFLLIVAFLVMFVANIFNKLVEYKNRFLNAFAQIEVQLKRRYDLIPNLLEAAKGYLAHEKDTLNAVTLARSGAISSLEKAHADPSNPANIQALGLAEQNLTSALKGLNISVEAYPDLKASENMIRLHEELASTENKISFARQSYNDGVMTFNTYRQSFPQNILAPLFGHDKDATLLEFNDSKVIQEAPKVKF